jgi:hypothetical protein
VGLESLLVQEVKAVAVAVEVGRRNRLQVGLLKLFTGFEGPVEDRIGQEVAHFNADQRLAAARSGGAHFHLQTGIRNVVEFE